MWTASRRAALAAALLNASLQTGLANPLDQAIVAAGKTQNIDTGAYHKLDEVPYDFMRKRLSVLVRAGEGDAAARHQGRARAGARGLQRGCARHGERTARRRRPRADRKAIRATTASSGFRVLAVACKRTAAARRPARAPTRPRSPSSASCASSIRRKTASSARSPTSCALGIRVKVITGDNRLVAAHVAAVGRHARASCGYRQ